MYKLCLGITLDGMFIYVRPFDRVNQFGIEIVLTFGNDLALLERTGKTQQCKRLCQDYYTSWLRLNQWSEMTQRGVALNGN